MFVFVHMCVCGGGWKGAVCVQAFMHTHMHTCICIIERSSISCIKMNWQCCVCIDFKLNFCTFFYFLSDLTVYIEGPLISWISTNLAQFSWHVWKNICSPNKHFLLWRPKKGYLLRNWHSLISCKNMSLEIHIGPSVYGIVCEGDVSFCYLSPHLPHPGRDKVTLLSEIHYFLSANVWTSS